MRNCITELIMSTKSLPNPNNIVQLAIKAEIKRLLSLICDELQNDDINLKKQDLMADFVDLLPTTDLQNQETIKCQVLKLANEISEIIYSEN